MGVSCFYNGVWVAVPLLLMWQSYKAMTDPKHSQEQDITSEQPAHGGYNLRSKNK